MNGFNMLALIEAGQIKEDEGPLALIQNIEPHHAHAFCKWLVLATGAPAHVRLMGIGQIEDIRYTPAQVEASMQRPEIRDMGSKAPPATTHQGANCPRCGQLLSYAGTEPYCAYTDCRWNNPA